MKIIFQAHRGYNFGSFAGLPRPQMDLLADQFGIPPESAPGSLGGRKRPAIIEIPDLGPVIVKHYFRGGLIRHINRRTYLDFKKSRGQIEFELLGHIRKIGINAPEPVAFATKGRFFYKGWLVTKLIQEAVTLVEISRSAPGRAEALMPVIAEQVGRLIASGILHVDLHPGNVLVDRKDRVFLIDFDRARTNQTDRNGLRTRYIRRWQRALKKYELPEFLNVREGLRGNESDAIPH